MCCSNRKFLELGRTGVNRVGVLEATYKTPIPDEILGSVSHGAAVHFSLIGWAIGAESFFVMILICFNWC